MTDALQQFWLAALDKILAGLPGIIAAIVAGVVVLKQANKKTVEKANETNDLIVRGAQETVVASTNNAGMLANKLDAVHETVNGNFTALQAKHDALQVENQLLKDQLTARAAKRSTDP